MAFTTPTNGSNTDLTFVYSVLTSKVAIILPKLARGLFTDGWTAGIVLTPGQTTSDLTNAQMKTIVDVWVRNAINMKVGEYHAKSSRDTAEVTAQQEILTMII